MKWLVAAGFLLCFAHSVRAAVLICTPGSKNEPCSRDMRTLKKSDLLFGKECLPGTNWTSHCNECTCSDEGLPSCTEKKCEGHESDQMLRCAPDSIWKNECNTCWCTSTGHAMCTRIGCNAHVVTNFNPDGEGEKFVEVPSVNDGENEENYFVDEDFEDHEIAKRSVCEPNKRFEIECNSCKCAPDGQSYSCTQSECLERDMDKEVEVFKESEGTDHVERHSVCKPRATFHVGCNTCHCNIVGTDFICATKPCALLNDVELFRELKELKTSSNSTKAVVCAANRMFIKDCNTCWCNEDGTSYFCTRKVCVPDLPDETTAEPEQELRVIKRQCRPDEVFELDCNMCRCNPDGKSFSCTRRACLPEDDNKETSAIRRTRATSQASSRSESSSSSRFQHNVKETPKTCQPGQEFRMDCNTCLCNSEGQDYSCTRIDCNALNNNNNGGARRKREVTSQVTSECTPGSVFQQGCKVCRCSDDGRHAICPTHCQKDKDHSNQKTENDISTESDPSFRCNPGETYKRFCNDCTCSADGKSVFCTLRLCEEEITPTI